MGDRRKPADSRIPSLDGLRAMSIALVVIAHMAGTQNFPPSEAGGNFWGLGEFGVRVFVVISGFLITGLLMDELAPDGQIRLGRFYLRRTLRIFPPYYTLLLALALAPLFGAVTLCRSWRPPTVVLLAAGRPVTMLTRASCPASVMV